MVIKTLLCCCENNNKERIGHRNKQLSRGRDGERKEGREKEEEKKG